MSKECKLIYFELDSKYPQEFIFINEEKFDEWLFDKNYKIRDEKKDRVYLFTWDCQESIPEIIITSMFETIAFDTNSFINISNIDTFHLHEYHSFEEAYKVALLMQEPSNLCYEPDVAQ